MSCGMYHRYISRDPLLLSRALVRPLTVGLLLLLCIATPSAHAQDRIADGEATPPTTAQLQLPGVALLIEAPYITFKLLPYANLGSHAQALGATATAYITLPELLILENIYFLLQTSYFYSFNNLGLPGESHTGFFSAALGVSVGGEGSLQNNFVPVGTRHHNIIYQYEYFLDTIGTSQALGLFGYYYSEPTWLLGFFFENDTLAFLEKDQFRTHAIEIMALFRTNGHTWGVGGGNKIWGGTTEGVSRQGHRGQIVDISPNHGGAYSHGIIYLSGYYESFKLSVGVDADEIRAAIQNGAHFFSNQSAIAPIAGIEPRVYIQLEVHPRLSAF